MYNYKYIGDPNVIETKGGFLVASGFSRVVPGGRGAYVEFLYQQIKVETLFVPQDQLWRLKGPSSPLAYYIEYRTSDNVKVYHQKKRVDYADYIPDRYYISPVHLKDFVRGEQL